MNLINEASPHFHGKGSTQWIMGMVCLSLLPTLVASVFLYGLGAPLLVLVCVATALVTEHVCCRLMNRESTAGDLSCVVTAMLFAFTLPANCGYFPAILGTVFAIAVVKMLFGGIGCNFANPAVAARVFIMLAMPIALGAYPDIMGRPLDAITGATPLAMNAAGDAPYSYMDMMFGLHAGALGETCIITLLAGYVFLLVMRVVDAWATVPFIATVAVITGFAGIGCGVITALVRLFAAAPEGVAFSILFMNMFTPLIDRYTRPQPAGGVKHALV